MRLGKYGLLLALLALLGVFLLAMGFVICTNRLNVVQDRVDNISGIIASNKSVE